MLGANEQWTERLLAQKHIPQWEKWHKNTSYSKYNYLGCPLNVLEKRSEKMQFFLNQEESTRHKFISSCQIECFIVALQESDAKELAVIHNHLAFNKIHLRKKGHNEHYCLDLKAKTRRKPFQHKNKRRDCDCTNHELLKILIAIFCYIK